MVTILIGIIDGKSYQSMLTGYWANIESQLTNTASSIFA